ncbi:MAG TPA: hypothetical protein VFM00_13480 [Candidatus Eisenbacteria bacterium]|nr:hypothetical protein [Candidatus Eisenbacteria bacterium]
MKAASRSASRHRTPAAASVFLLLALLSEVGCAHWQPVQRERIADTLRDSKPDYARVGAGGSVLLVQHPEVRADTLHGTMRADHRAPVTIPLASVDSLSLYRNGRTDARLFAIGMLTISVLFVAAALNVNRSLQ